MRNSVLSKNEIELCMGKAEEFLVFPNISVDLSFSVLKGIFSMHWMSTPVKLKDTMLVKLSNQKNGEYHDLFELIHNTNVVEYTATEALIILETVKMYYDKYKLSEDFKI